MVFSGERHEPGGVVVIGEMLVAQRARVIEQRDAARAVVQAQDRGFLFIHC